MRNTVEANGQSFFNAAQQNDKALDSAKDTSIRNQENIMIQKAKKGNETPSGQNSFRVSQQNNEFQYPSQKPKGYQSHMNNMSQFKQYYGPNPGLNENLFMGQG